MSKTKTKSSLKPLALGPADLEDADLGGLDPDRLRELIGRHLAAHLPILVDEAVADTVEPVAASLVENLRTAITRRLVEEKDTLIEDILEELVRNPD